MFLNELQKTVLREILGQLDFEANLYTKASPQPFTTDKKSATTRKKAAAKEMARTLGPQFLNFINI